MCHSKPKPKPLELIVETIALDDASRRQLSRPFHDILHLETIRTGYRPARSDTPQPNHIWDWCDSRAGDSVHHDAIRVRPITNHSPLRNLTMTIVFSVIKTRMQSLEARTQYKNSFHCAYRIFTEEGILRFWAGTTPRLVRLVVWVI